MAAIRGKMSEVAEETPTSRMNRDTESQSDAATTLVGRMAKKALITRRHSVDPKKSSLYKRPFDKLLKYNSLKHQRSNYKGRRNNYLRNNSMFRDNRPRKRHAVGKIAHRAKSIPKYGMRKGYNVSSNYNLRDYMKKYMEMKALAESKSAERKKKLGLASIMSRMKSNNTSGNGSQSSQIFPSFSRQGTMRNNDTPSSRKISDNSIPRYMQATNSRIRSIEPDVNDKKSNEDNDSNGSKRRIPRRYESHNRVLKGLTEKSINRSASSKRNGFSFNSFG
jgi:hypothetical protein